MSYFVYILSNWNHHVLYVRVTNDLKRRIYEHKSGLYDGFTKRYYVHKLLYYEKYGDVQRAISREKQLKTWSREKKNDLISRQNPEWLDLSGGF